MLKRFLAIALAALVAAPVFAEDPAPDRDPGPYDKLITKMVARMLTQQHYAHPEIDDDASKDMFDEYFSTLDPQRIYFLKADLDSFDGYRLLLDDHVKQGDLTFAFAVYELYLKRLNEFVAFAKERLNQPFDFTTDESLVVDRSDVAWPATAEERQDVWRKLLKNRMLIEALRAEIPNEDDEDKPSEIAKTMTPVERMIKRYEYVQTKMSGNDTSDVLELYLTSMAKVFDPHSVYWNRKSLEDFTIQMSQKLRGIGATLQDDNGYTKVTSLVPGGPADLQGELAVDDLIIAVTQEGGETVNVIDMPLDRVVDQIRGEIDTKVTLTVTAGLNGKQRKITITRDEVKLEDSRASSEVKPVTLPNGKTVNVGVVDLPSFYADFDGQRRGDKDAASTSGDVRRLIDEMREQHDIQGLVIDLRSNGGGSLTEAIKLSGMFIKTGPVVQQRQRVPARVSGGIDFRMHTKIHTDDDPFEYDLPLIVMTNRFSASASEIFAGCIQDYGRGVIVGDKTTHGKGTVQTITDLKDRYPLLRKVEPGAVKYTVGKFYRATGASTQKKGVIPDIVFPSFLEFGEFGEAHLDHVMPWDEIPSADVAAIDESVRPLIDDLRARSERRRQENEAFRVLAEDIAHYGARQEELKSITLNKDKRKVLIEEEREWSKKREAVLGASDRKKKSDDDKKETDPETAEADAEEKKPDLYLDETVAIMGDLITAGNPSLAATATADKPTP